MIIDFHTHAFADNIAERAMAKLTETAQIEHFTDGTVLGLRNKLKNADIDFGVLLPIATKPTQQKTINDWAASVNSGNLISFGTVHPCADDIKEELIRIKSLGLKGIKLHPDYQSVYLFDDKMNIIYRTCEELGLPIIIHMGYDPVCPLERHAMPYHLVEVNEKYPHLVLIAAHFGGMYAWEEVLKYLCGRKNIYLDTGYIDGFIDKELMFEIIKKHGIEKILFGSDLPWHDPRAEIELINSLSLSKAERERIFFFNAAELLQLEESSYKTE